MKDDRLGRLVLPSLVLSRFAYLTPTVVVGLLLVDIATTFQCPVGVAGQLQTVSSIVGLLASLVMGIASIRFSSASLLLAGLSFLCISALGSSLAPNFASLLALYSIAGLGSAIVSPMTGTIVGERFPLAKRSNAVGWLVAGMSLANVVGAPTVGFLSGLGGWRLAFIGYAFPVSLLTLFLVVVSVGVSRSPRQHTGGSSAYVEGFGAVFSSVSAIACLVGTSLGMASYQAILLYAASFYRQSFGMSTGFVSVITIFGALLFTAGSLTSGRLVNRFGSKTVSAFSAFAACLPIFFFTSLSDPWLSIGVMYLGRLFTGVMTTAANTLILEQVPKFRGTMMSLSQAGSMLGNTLGGALGGWALLVSGYGLVGMLFGVLMALAAIVFQVLSKEPKRPET